MVQRCNLLSALLLARLLLYVPMVVGVSLPLLLSGCAPSLSRRPHPPVWTPLPAHPPAPQVGIASWYGPGFHGQPTANGESYDQNALTAAHPTLPLGTRVEVTNLDTGKSVQVRINDRGPFVRGRKIDLSRGAARKLGMLRPGLSRVRIRPLPAHRTGSLQSATSRSRRTLPKRTRQVRRQRPQGTSLRKRLATLWLF